MFKVILEANIINSNEFIDKMLKEAKGKGIKLPPMVNATMIKMMPQQAKNKMLVTAFETEKPKMMEMIRQTADKFLSGTQISDMQLIENDSSGDIQLELKVARMNYDFVSEKFAAYILENEDLPEVFGEGYTDTITVETMHVLVRNADANRKEYLVLKSMSVKKNKIMQLLEQKADQNGIKMKINNLKFLLWKQN